MFDLHFIHRYLPPKGSSSRTLLLLHGTGGNEDDLLTLGAELAPQAGMLSPRGKVVEDGNLRFFRRLAEGVFDQDDLRRRTEELAEFLKAAASRYAFDPDQVVAVGYSNGANIASSLLLRHPYLLLGAALLHGQVPFTPDSLPDLAGKEVFIGAGENDPLVSRNETLKLAKMLVDSGADVETAWFVAGHHLSAPEVSAASAWLDGLENVIEA